MKKELDELLKKRAANSQNSEIVTSNTLPPKLIKNDKIELIDIEKNHPVINPNFLEPPRKNTIDVQPLDFKHENPKMIRDNGFIVESKKNCLYCFFFTCGSSIPAQNPMLFINCFSCWNQFL